MLVLAQVRIAPVLKMEEYIPELQDQLRRTLPRCEARQDVQLQLGPAMAVQSATSWEFQSKDRTRSVVVARDFITVQTTKYDVYENFEEFLTAPLQVLADVVEPSLVQRIGLRYVDLIRRTPDLKLEEFIQPGLRGMTTEAMGATDALFRFETLADTPVGTMRVRCMQSQDGSSLPADLRGTKMSLDFTPAADLPATEKVMFLDLDHFSETPIDYTPPAVVEVIGGLHDNLDRAFRAAVTDAAMAAWRKTEC